MCQATLIESATNIASSIVNQCCVLCCQLSCYCQEIQHPNNWQTVIQIEIKQANCGPPCWFNSSTALLTELRINLTTSTHFGFNLRVLNHLHLWFCKFVAYFSGLLELYIAHWLYLCNKYREQKDQ